MMIFDRIPFIFRYLIMEVFQNLKQLYSSFDQYLAEKSSPLSDLNIDELVSQVLLPGPFYHYILDSPTLTFDKCSASTQEILGTSLENKSLEVLFERVHPEDIPFVLSCEKYVADFISNKISPDKVTSYKFSYAFRVKGLNGTYRQFLVQNLTVKSTPNGSLLKVLGIHCDISHITNSNNYKLSITGINGEPSYLGININSADASESPATNNPFTIREMDVIRLLLQGYISKEIAEMLNISKETVDSHKKNALRKTKLKNSVQLATYCLQNSLI